GATHPGGTSRSGRSAEPAAPHRYGSAPASHPPGGRRQVASAPPAPSTGAALPSAVFDPAVAPLASSPTVGLAASRTSPSVSPAVWLPFRVRSSRVVTERFPRSSLGPSNLLTRS